MNEMSVSKNSAKFNEGPAVPQYSSFSMSVLDGVNFTGTAEVDPDL